MEFIAETLAALSIFVVTASVLVVMSALSKRIHPGGRCPKCGRYKLLPNKQRNCEPYDILFVCKACGYKDE